MPKESAPNEKRVAATPDSTRKLTEMGFKVSIQRGAGALAEYPDDAYVAAGASIVDASEVWGASDVVVKVRPPALAEVASLREGTLLVSLLQPERNPGLTEAIAQAKASVLALERIPRISRAQKMDVLSSQANLSGNRAIIEAAAHFQGVFGQLVTAAGSSPPAKVLVIGAGVAGLAAIAAAKAMGAEVRAFDTREAAREQVESLGARFLTIAVEESGDGGGGYAKVMSQAFIDAEMALFRAQAAEVDVIVTTALVPGTKAPILVPQDVVEALRPGSIIVDMAAEQGGNCVLTRPGEVALHNGVQILGFTDLASRIARPASRFFATNMVHLFSDMGGGAKFHVDLESEVIRPALVVYNGAILPPPPRKEPSPAPAPKPKPALPPPDAQAHNKPIMQPTRTAWGSTVAGMLVIAGLFALGRFAPGDFLQHFTVFVLACFVGWQVIWSVAPALHTPLMSVTNAISGIIIVGGMLQIGAGADAASVLGAVAVLVAAINVAGGFLVTQRMLAMFHREGPS